MLHTLDAVDQYHVQFTSGADEAFDQMPVADRREFAERVVLVLQTNPHRGDAAYEVFASPSIPGLYHVTFGSSIASYSIDPAQRMVRVSEFSF